MIAVSGLSKSFGAQTLFEDASFQLDPGKRYGLVGANGSGKSTLLKMLAGDEIVSDGEISIPKRARVGVLRQDHFAYENERILDVAMMGNTELWQAMQEKDELLANADNDFDAERYAELEDIVVRHDGYRAEAAAGEILEGLGIPTERHQEPLSALSGGFRLRVLLAQVLAANPDVLLLDEPTNHLDVLSIRWLEKFLSEFAGVVVVVSHDHRFLDNVVTHILDVDYETVILYPGNYSDFSAAKVEHRRLKEGEIAKREREIEHHKAFVERFRAKATKARQAKSKQKLIDRIEIEKLPQSSRRYPLFSFPSQRPSGKDVLTIEGLSKAYGDQQVLKDVDLTVRRGERLAIMGPNGIGKSTLLKIVTGRLEADSGSVTWGYETHPGYFAQDHKDLIPESAQSVEAWLWEAVPGESIGFVRGKLGQVLFSGDDVKKRLSSLSGGEAARLVFARLGVEQPNVLLLDEPTNHLDLEAIEALVEGVREFEGTLLFVSHDRWFVSQLADRILELTPDGARDYRGTYDEYVHDCGDDHLDADALALKVRRDKRRRKQTADPVAAASSKNELRKIERRRDELIEVIEKAEARIAEINDTFANPAYFAEADPKQVRKLEAELNKLRESVETNSVEWEQVERQLEEMTVEVAS